MGDCACEDYIFSLQEFLNGAGWPVGIRDFSRGQYADEEKNHQGQEPCFPSLQKKEEQQCKERECQDKEDDRLRGEVMAYNNATSETE